MALPTAERNWLTPAEAAQYLRVAHSTIYRWARKGLLTLYRVGEGTTRLRRAEIEALARPLGLKEQPPVDMSRRRAAVARLKAIRTTLAGRNVDLGRRVIEGRGELEDHA
jgi:excisionase family DNA binding protein